MIKVIYENLFVTVKSKFYYIVALFVLGISILSLYGVYHTLFIDDAASNYAIFQMVNDNNNCFFDYAAEVLSGNFLSLFVAISVPMIICEPFTNGYIKNVYNYEIQKKYYVTGKVTIIFLVVMFYTLFTLVATAISGIIMFDFDGIGNVGEYIRFAFLQILCNLSFGCILMFVSEIFRKLSLSMISGILYVVMLCDLLYKFINSLFSNLGYAKFDISNYTVMGNMTNLTMNSSKEDIIRTIIVAVVYIIVFSVLTQFIFLRRDVN